MTSRLGDLVINIVPEQGVPGGFVLTPNNGHVTRGKDITWLPHGTAVSLFFPMMSPFPGVILEIPDGGSARLTVSEIAVIKPFNYGVFSHSSGRTLDGDDGNDPTIIID